MAFPNTIPLEQIDRKHPMYAEREREWEILSLLADGGMRLKSAAKLFLHRKHREPSDFYEVRCQQFSYQNILGPVLDWYRARFANAHSEITLTRSSKLVEDAWYAKFLASCERPGSRRESAIQGFLADRLKDLLLYGCAYTLVDKPSPDGEVRTLLDQRRAGLLDPYLVGVDAKEVIDWAESEEGSLEYAVIRCNVEYREFGKAPVTKANWYVYTRTEFAHYQAELASDQPREKTATLIATGPHALSGVEQLPIVCWKASKGQWLADRAILSLVSHLNLLNSNSWSMFNALLPMLIIQGELNSDSIRSEIAYLQIPDGDAKYLSPDPGVFEVAEKTLERQKEEAYRQMHVQAQARTSSATAHAQSGVSKQEDMTAATDVLNGFGTDMRAYASSVMRAVILARGDDGLEPKISGWQFEPEVSAELLDAAERCDALGIGSDTFDREIRKRLVRSAIADMPATVLVEIDKEIDTSEPPAAMRKRESEAATAALRQAAQRSQTTNQEADGAEDGVEDSTEED